MTAIIDLLKVLKTIRGSHSSLSYSKEIVMAIKTLEQMFLKTETIILSPFAVELIQKALSPYSPDPDEINLLKELQKQFTLAVKSYYDKEK